MVIDESSFTKTAVNSSASARAQLVAVCKEYMTASTNVDGWWLKESQQPSANLNLKLSNGLTNIYKVINTSKSASPHAREVAEAFPRFLVTQFINGGSIAVKDGDFNQGDLNGAIEVCFIPESEFRRGYMGSTLFYRGDWNAVMIGAVNWPDTFFRGVLMHELGHALENKRGRRMRNFTREWFEEEVAMHKLETQVFDHSTAGQYSGKLLQIYKKHQNESSVIKFMASISANEMLELDEVIGVRDCGNDVRGPACTQHMVSLGFVYIDQKNASASNMDAKVEHYRWIIGK